MIPALPAKLGPDESEERRDGALPRSLILIVATACYVPMGLLSIGWIWWRSGWSELGARLWPVHPLAEIGIGALCGLGVVLLCHLARLTLRSVGRLEASFARAIGPIGAGTALMLAVTSSVGEELLFRAALQPEIGVWLTALVFGALHVPIDRDLWLWPPFAASTGLLLGWLYERNGCVIAPTTAHFVINAIHLELIRRRARRIHGVEFAPVSRS